MKVRYRWMIILLAVAALLTAGCDTNQETNVTLGTLEDELAAVYQIQQDYADLDTIINTLFGMTSNEALSYICCDEHGTYEVDYRFLNVTAIDETSSDKQQVMSVSYGDEIEGAYSCYTGVLVPMMMRGMGNGIMRQIFPDEKIKDCSKQEAIEACRPYAEACGYTDCEISVYAAVRDLFRNNEAFSKGGHFNGAISAPGPNFNYVTCRQLLELKQQMEVLDKDSEEYKKISREYSLQEYSKRQGIVIRDLIWEFEHEAMILTYQPRLGKYAMAEQQDLLMIIYAPKYGVVCIQGNVPYEIVRETKKVAVISQKEAWNQLLKQNGYGQNEDIVLKQMTLVYVPDDAKEIANPYWSIEYMKDDLWNQVLIDAQAANTP